MSVQKNHTALAVLFGAVCAVLLPASCQRDVPAGGMSREQELDITVSAVLPSVPVSVKSAENAGDGTSANRCILEVYENGVFSGARYVAPVQDMGAVFEDVHLIAGGSYELVFWADCASEGEDGSFTDLYYGTEAGLTQISLNTDNYINSDDGHDAFCAVLSVAELSDDQPLEATLTRPFGQIRLYTDDLDWLPEPVVDLTQIRAEVAFSHIFTMDVTVDLLRRYFTNGKQSSGSIL